MNNRLIKSNDAGGGACTNTVDLYNPFPDGGGVALYQLNGDATDVSGNYNGVVTGTLSYNTGVFGQAADFSSNDAAITANTFISSLTDTQDFSISMWFKNDGFTSPAFKSLIGANGSASQGVIRVLLSYVSANTYTIEFARGYNSNYYSYDETPNITLLSSSWYNLSITFNSSLKKIEYYLNGSLISYGNIAVTSPGVSISNQIVFGQYINSGAYPTYSWGGSIDQVRIFNRALRPYEVEALYTEEYCTPTIVPSEHFNTVLWTGNEVSGRQITGVGFQPDFVWIKDRGDGTHWHNLFDSVRGVSERLFSNSTIAESFYNESLQSFNSDGFTVGFDPDVNRSGGAIVGWSWKAGGAAVSNTDGTITSQVSANTEAGFSVVSYTTQSSGTATVGHGLNTEPNIVLVKTTGVADSWRMYHSSLGAGSQIYLNLTNAAGSTANQWNNTAPTSSVFSLGTDNAGSYTTIAYCFAEVEGFSNFGSYVGNGSTSGPTVITGFEPAFLLIKQSSASGEYWNIWDNKRSPENPRSDVLFPNLANAEASNQSWSDVQFLENGFQVTPTVMTPTNQSGATYIYMAFAADPTAVEPTLEDSFNTVLYTGDGTSNRTISGYGFDPDFLWMKPRNFAYSNNLYDTVRGDGIRLVSNSTAGDQDIQYLKFTTDGFIEDASRNNENGVDYVVWGWKGAEIPAINSNGSIPSVVSANPAAGFSIVSYTGNSIIGSTVGHGLNTTPDVVIYKGRQEGLPQYFASWGVYHSSLGATQRLWLNNTGAAQTAGGGDWINNTEPTDSVFTVGEYYTNWTGRDFIAYCFAEVAGFSKFGSYSGTGVNGNFIATGFEPAFVMVKRTNAADNWVIVDNKRGTSNSLFPDLSSQELSNFGAATFSSTGFTVNGASGGWNNSSSTYIYMAFANQF